MSEDQTPYTGPVVVWGPNKWSEHLEKFPPFSREKLEWWHNALGRPAFGPGSPTDVLFEKMGW